MTNRLHFDFGGTSVLVTGGTSGIGHAIAAAFADAGASVTVTGTRASAAEYDTDLSPFTYRRLEMRDRDAIDALAAELEALDVLVNNAGRELSRRSRRMGPRRLLCRARPQRRRRNAADGAVTRGTRREHDGRRREHRQHRLDDRVPVDDHRAGVLGGEGRAARAHPQPRGPLGGRPHPGERGRARV